MPYKKIYLFLDPMVVTWGTQVGVSDRILYDTIEYNGNINADWFIDQDGTITADNTQSGRTLKFNNGTHELPVKIYWDENDVNPLVGNLTDSFFGTLLQTWGAGANSLLGNPTLALVNEEKRLKNDNYYERFSSFIAYLQKIPFDSSNRKEGDPSFTTANHFKIVLNKDICDLSLYPNSYASGKALCDFTNAVRSVTINNWNYSFGAQLVNFVFINKTTKKFDTVNIGSVSGLSMVSLAQSSRKHSTDPVYNRAFHLNLYTNSVGTLFTAPVKFKQAVSPSMLIEVGLFLVRGNAGARILSITGDFDPVAFEEKTTIKDVNPGFIFNVNIFDTHYVAPFVLYAQYTNTNGASVTCDLLKVYFDSNSRIATFEP